MTIPITPIVQVQGTPIVLSDTIFINYGGQTGTSTAFARNAAYLIAEREVCSHLHTPLVPTNISGSYNWNAGNPFEMDWGNINTIYGVTVQSNLNTLYVYSANDMLRAVFIRNAKYGIVDIQSWPMMYQITSTAYPVASLQPYSVLVTYNAGMAVGVATQPDILWCLTMAAQLVINEMSVDGSMANEAPGGIGITQFSNELYSEHRTALGASIFGASPVSQQITRLLASYRTRSIGRMRR
jgi:hypothetical protein